MTTNKEKLMFLKGRSLENIQQFLHTQCIGCEWFIPSNNDGSDLIEYRMNNHFQYIPYKLTALREDKGKVYVLGMSPWENEYEFEVAEINSDNVIAIDDAIMTVKDGNSTS